MWKSGWKIDKEWLCGKEKWLFLLICGLILLILSFPAGSGSKGSGEEAGSPAVRSGSYWGDGQGAEEGRLSGGGRLSEAGPNLGGTQLSEAGQNSEGTRLSEAGQNSGGGQEAAGKASAQSLSDEERLYEKELEQRVKDILKYVDGVGEVDVMIALKSSKEKVLHVDKDKSRSSTEEKDSAGGTRKAMTEEIKESSLMSGGNGVNEPVIEKELQPEIAGIVISARGGGSAAVKAEISEAMEALFGLPAHKIKVLKRVE